MSDWEITKDHDSKGNCPANDKLIDELSNQDISKMEYDEKCLIPTKFVRHILNKSDSCRNQAISKINDKLDTICSERGILPRRIARRKKTLYLKRRFKGLRHPLPQ